MASTQDKVTRFDIDLIDSAAAEGARQHRSARQQLAYWARVGRAVTSHESAARARIEGALAGTVPLAELTVDESRVLDAEVAARVEETLATTHFGSILLAEGVNVVALDDAGDLVEYHVDGTTAPLRKSA